MWSGLLWLLLAQPPFEHRCVLRLSASGVMVDGNPMTRDQAIGVCKWTSGATVIVEDGVAPDVSAAMRGELERAHVKIYVRGVIDDRDCVNLDNPLAKGCQ